LSYGNIGKEVGYNLHQNILNNIDEIFMERSK